MDQVNVFPLNLIKATGEKNTLIYLLYLHS